MSYEKPVIRDYGDVAELTKVIVIGKADDAVQKSSDLGVIKQGR